MALNREIILLVDYKGQFYCALKGTRQTMRLSLVERYFRDAGWDFRVLGFHMLDFSGGDFDNKVVLYQSSEDDDLRYKSFIEDIALGLKLAGARLIPPFEYLRAHHNKVFMEILRSLSPEKRIKTLDSRWYGTLEEFMDDIDNVEFPVVIKTAASCKSQGVALIESRESARKVAARISRSFGVSTVLENIYWTRLRGERVLESNHRNKFIVQRFVPGLSGDFRVLVFGEKYYVLKRTARKNDFRASGSGEASWPEVLPDGLLPFARRVKEAFDVPFIHLDILGDEGDFHLGEFQFLRFGTNAMQRSPHHFLHRQGEWVCVKGASELEREFVDSILSHLQKEASSPRFP